MKEYKSNLITSCKWEWELVENGKVKKKIKNNYKNNNQKLFQAERALPTHLFNKMDKKCTILFFKNMFQ